MEGSSRVVVVVVVLSFNYLPLVLLALMIFC